jgi:ribosomal protein S18 acetylase RimI-like enzyme
VKCRLVDKTSSYKNGKFYNVSRFIRNLREKDEKYRYLVMKLPWDRIPKLIKQLDVELANHPNKDNIKFKPYDKTTDDNLFVDLANKIILTSPDPYRPLMLVDGDKFSEGTFIVYLHGHPIGFLVCTVEEENDERLGVIAGLGMLPRYRQQRLGMLTCLKAAEFFKDKQVDALVCDVFEGNKPSYSLITSMGFEYSHELELD